MSDGEPLLPWRHVRKSVAARLGPAGLDTDSVRPTPALEINSGMEVIRRRARIDDAGREERLFKGNFNLGVAARRGGVDRSHDVFKMQSDTRPFCRARQNNDGNAPARKILLVPNSLVRGEQKFNGGLPLPHPVGRHCSACPNLLPGL